MTQQRQPPITARPRMPHGNPLEIDGLSVRAALVTTALTPFVSEARRRRIEAVLESRTYTVVPVLDGLYDLGNVNAVLRSAEALGFQAAHIIATSPKSRPANRVAQGADKWLDLHTWPAPGACLDALGAQGYSVLAADLSADVTIDELDFTQPTAIVFGNEHEGVCPEILSAADARFRVPMLGFTESFNISVAAAVCLYHVVRDRRKRLGAHGDLSAHQRDVLRAVYYIRAVDFAAAVVRRAARSTSSGDATLPRDRT